jgi:hypothetical protein
LPKFDQRSPCFKPMAKTSVSHCAKGAADVSLLWRYETAMFPSFCRCRQSSASCLRRDSRPFDNGFSKLWLFCSVFSGTVRIRLLGQPAMLLAVASEHCRRTDVANHVPEHKLPVRTVWACSNTLFETKETPQRLNRLEGGIKDAQLHGDGMQLL